MPTTYCTCITGLSFIINSKVSVQRGFSVHLSCEYALLWSVQPPLCSPLLLLSHHPSFSCFQCVSLCPLPVQMWSITILLTLCHSFFLSLLHRVP
jgi:hypothetical protein